MKDRHSNLPLLFVVALATALGIAAGLPMILRKNGMGLGVTLLVSAIAIVGIALSARQVRKANRTEIVSNLTHRKKHSMANGLASLLLGPLITVGGGLIVHCFDPMHPLDFIPTLTSLAFLGVFAGLTVGVVLTIATIIWQA